MSREIIYIKWLFP